MRNLHSLRTLTAVAFTILLSGCGTTNSSSPASLVPNTNQLSLSNIRAITVQKFHYGSESKSIASVAVTSKEMSEIVKEINQSQIVNVVPGTPLVSPTVGPQTIVYHVIVHFKDRASTDTFEVGPPWSGTFDENHQSTLNPGISEKLLSKLVS